ncbi:BA75_03293T0 [Komagataella pastoris]|uniref:DNA replication complex GINS protein PSF1 n=1 Tax=Komagataella pastoris TaxID=4922 RepID=A0A1B2JBC8_PICPA|nr:BA75_03293T0 [Komagataella pastoris]
MFGDTANKLILDAKRSKALDGLPMYQEHDVRDIIRETRDLQKESDIIASQDTNAQDRVKHCQLFVTHLSMRRNKRCLLGYQRSRVEKLMEIAWNGQEMDPQQVENLSHHEQEYFKKYSNLVALYKSPFQDVDVSGTLEPPKEIFIDVRVLKDAGEILTEYGVFNLTKDSQFFVRQADVEKLIQQGYLEKL